MATGRVKKIIMFKTTDDRQFNSEIGAEKHEALIALEKGLEEEFHCIFEVDSDQEAFIIDNSEYLAEIITDHREEISRLFDIYAKELIGLET